MKSLLIPVVVCLAWPPETAADDLFRDQVAPLLQKHCLGCHNDRDEKGGFSLQTRSGMLDSGHVIPARSADSYLVELITPVDGQAGMPPSGPSLAPSEIAALVHWIDQGAHWPDGTRLELPAAPDHNWWSWQPVRQPPVPPHEDNPWIRTPIDAFVLQRLQQHGLTPAPRADRRTLIRRLYFDLLGLPPTPAEVEAFVNDPDPDAWSRLVNRLLESPHYGEHWARHWLDVVQYADTCGYDKDKLRPHAWPYRDYVIRSLNHDKPWSRFVQEQIAGDFLFPDQPDSVIALGFIAAGPWDFIGHVEVAESKIDGQVARNLDRDNMLGNTLNTFCSLTVQCARCHDHKFDPLTMEDYYALQAVFAAVDRAEREYDLEPDTGRQRRQWQEQLELLDAEQKRIDADITAVGGNGLAELDQAIIRLQANTDGHPVRQTPRYGWHSRIAATADTEKQVALHFAPPVAARTIRIRPCHDEFAGIGSGFGFPLRFRLRMRDATGQWHTLLDQSGADYANPGLRPVTVAIPGDSTVAEVRIEATRLMERSGDYIFALAEVEILDQQQHNLTASARLSATDSIEAPQRWGLENLTDGNWPQREPDPTQREGFPVAFDSLEEAIAERDRRWTELQTPQQQQRLEQIRLAREATRQQLRSLPRPNRVYAAATRFEPEGHFHPTRGVARPIHVLRRGDVRQPGKRIGPALLSLGPDQPARTLDPQWPEARHRAELAGWLTRPDHPLVWRSIVNRVWQYHFGTGLVATPNDFGRMGSRPTHPHLLDWLAVEFRDNGQSLKQLHRLIVTSNTYCQSSEFRNREAVRQDSENRLLWRMNRRRLSAESIRDSILAISGALDLTPGGPGFYLFALEKTEHSPHYEYHKFDPADPATHRRSIYRFVVRSQPDPWMTTLDCADSSQSTPLRSETLTALQALSLLNSPFILEMANRFAERLESSQPDRDHQVQEAFQLVLQRPPDPQERSEMVAFAGQHGLPALARVLFNLNEFVYID